MCTAVWEVVGGQEQDGILVREGMALSSTQLDRRLATGARVEQMGLEGIRLQYRRLDGEGPDTGWVSIRIGQRDLLIRANVSAFTSESNPDAKNTLKSELPVPCVRSRPRQPSPRRKWQVLCIGDSITAGGYPRYLEFKFHGFVDVKDFGVKGTAVVPGSFPAYGRLPRLAVRLRNMPPDVIIVMLGTNDAHRATWHEDNFVQEYVKLLRDLVGPDPGRLILVGVPPRVKANGWGVDVDIMEEELPRAVHQAAAAFGLPVFDPRPTFGTRGSMHLMPHDNVHLQESGHELLAHVVAHKLWEIVEAEGWDYYGNSSKHSQ